MRQEISSKKSQKMRFSEKRPQDPFFMISPFLKLFFISFFICKFRTPISSTLASHLSLPLSDRTNRLLAWLTCFCLFICLDCPFLLRHHRSRPHRLALSMSMTPGSLFMLVLESPVKRLEKDRRLDRT